MKKLTSVLILAGLLVSLCAPISAAGVSANPSTNSVYVDGKQANVAGYNIGGNNYFKLRDIAAALNGSIKQFNVTWAQDKQAISISPYTAYAAVGGELAGEKLTAAPAVPSTAKVYDGSTALALTGYNIKQNNYYKLRDVGRTLNMGIDYDATTGRVDISTEKIYLEDGQRIEPPKIEGETETLTKTLEVTGPDADIKVPGVLVTVYKAHRAADRSPVIEYKVDEQTSGEDGRVMLSWEVPTKDAVVLRGEDQYYAIIHAQAVNGIQYEENGRFLSIRADLDNFGSNYYLPLIAWVIK